MDGGVRRDAGLARFHDGGLLADIREDRVWQEIIYPALSLGSGEVSGHTRLEQRMPNAGGDTGWRLRYSRTLSEDVSLSAWNEVFWTLNDMAAGPAPGFDQNRLGVSIGWRATQLSASRQAICRSVSTGTTPFSPNPATCCSCRCPRPSDRAIPAPETKKARPVTEACFPE